MEYKHEENSPKLGITLMSDSVVCSCDFIDESPKLLFDIERIDYNVNEILYNAVVTLTSITKSSNFDASAFKSMDKVCQMLYNKYKENK